MAWEHLDVNKPHLVYIILGGFTSLFMLCSTVIKERLYIGEATVATLVGLIFGPHAANLINPDTWGNTDQITLEFSRIVLVVQCFAVGVELPRAYMERHWKSVVFLLVPVMTFGWLMTSLFIWGLFGSHLNWLDSLVCAACVTATDPVLASSVVGKGKFAKRVPKHLRDILSAESGCNDGMAFPFIYLAIYLTRYRPNVNEVALHWFCYTILYECIFGAVYGFTVGYLARRAIRYAHERDLIDRESFLVFYFVLALFCAGSGSILGADDLLIGFACGVGFSNDGWFTEKTEESHVSNVIDLLINLAFFVYLGAIIPWEQFNSHIIGTSAWKMVVLALLVLFFRRIPIMLLLKPVIPDVKTWREALFAGHFGPIGVGAIFVAILARAELETETTTPLGQLPEEGFEHLNIIELIWPITTFLVITSIIVHGSSIAVFTLGKHINTLTITMSFTQADEERGNWMDRLPRIQSRSKSTMSSIKNADESEDSLGEKLPESPSGVLALPSGFLRRQREEDTPKPSARSRASSKGSSRRRRPRSSSRPGGPVSQSAIAPIPRDDDVSPGRVENSDSTTLNEKGDEKSEQSPDSIEKLHKHPSGNSEEPEEEIFQEGNDTVIEDEEGNVLEVMHARKGETEEQRRESAGEEARKLMSQDNVQHGVAKKIDPDEDQALQRAVHHVEADAKDFAAAAAKGHGWKNVKQKMPHFGVPRRATEPKPAAPTHAEPQQRHHAPARAFRFGRTIIVEDEDGEVIKKYDIPAGEAERKQSYVAPEKTRQRLKTMGSWLGVGHNDHDHHDGEPSSSAAARPQAPHRKSTFRFNAHATDDDDQRIRFTVDGNDRRMSKAEFIKQIQGLDPKSRATIVEGSNVPEQVKREARADAAESKKNEETFEAQPNAIAWASSEDTDSDMATVEKVPTNEEHPSGPEGLMFVDSRSQGIPFHSIPADLQAQSTGGESAAQRRRRLAAQRDGNPPSRPATVQEEDSDDDGTERVPPSQRRRRTPSPQPRAAVRSRDEDSDDDGTERVPPSRRRQHSPAHVQRAESDYFGRGALVEGEETAAERRRREGALGLTRDDSDSDEDESQPREPPRHAVPANPQERRGIRFADQDTARSRARAEESGPGSGSGSGGTSSAGAAGEGSSPGGGKSRIRWSGV